MIKGRQKVILTKEDILKKISTYDIYRYYQGPFTLNEVCVNRHRGEKDPSLIIGNKLSGDLTHKDFGDYKWRGDAFHFVEQIFQCDFATALKIIDRDFNLGLQEGKDIKVVKSITWEAPKIELKKPPLFQISYYSKMSKSYLDYWAKLHQGESDLKRENIFQPKEIWRNKKRIPLGELMTFVYYYSSIDKWKIYRPFAPKKELHTPMNKWKWDSNVPFNYVDNLKNISPDCHRAFLAKSKKDRMVLMTALQTDCIADVQAEDPACLSEDSLNLFLQVKNRWVISDNDKKGKEFSWWLTRHHDFKHVNVPDKYLNSIPKCTDFADLCYNYDINLVIDHFKRKKIL